MAKDYTALKKQFLESSKDFEEKLLLAKSSIIRSTIYITDTQDKLTDEATLDTIRNQIITNKKIANINISLDSISLVVSRYSQKVDTIEDVYAREYINNFSKSGQLKRWASNGATITVDNTKGYALKLTTAGRQEAYSDMFEVSPTNTFKVSFSLNSPNVNNSGTVSFKVYAYDKNKSLVSCKSISSSTITDSTDIELFATKNTTNNTYQTFSGYVYGCNTAVDTNVPKGEMMRAMKLSENVRYLSIRLILNCVEPYGDGNNHTVYIADPFIGDIDNSVVSINSKLTEAFIKLEPDKIMQVVSNKVYTKEEVNSQISGVEDKVDNMQIGTRNLLIGTSFSKPSLWNYNPSKWSLNDKKTPNRNYSFYCNSTGETDPQWYWVKQLFRNFQIGSEYTLSAYIYIPENHDIDRGASLEIICMQEDGKRTLTKTTPISSLETGSWIKYNLTFTVPPLTTKIDCGAYIVANGKMYVGDFMLTLGNRAVEWNQSLEDIQTEIDKVQPGIRNLLLKSAIFAWDGSDTPNNSNISTSGVLNVATTTTRANAYIWLFYNDNGSRNKMSMKPDCRANEYTLSIDVRTNTGIDPTKANIEVAYWHNSSTTQSKKVELVENNGEWKRYSVTMSTQSDIDVNRILLCFNVEVGANLTKLEYREVSFTLGNRLVDWMPAPEDTQASIEGVQNNLDNLSIGVTNLLVNSNFKKGLSYYTIANPSQTGTIEVVDFQGRKCVHFDNVGYWDVSKYLRTPNFAVKQGDKVTFSADFYLTAGTYLAVDYAGVLDRGDNHITVPTLNKWYRLSATSTVGATADGSASLSLYAWGREHRVSGYLTLFKAEVGEKATAWSEALEDIQDQFTQTNKTVETYKSQVSELSASVDKITARVENSEEKITGVEKFTILKQLNNFSSSGVLERWSKSGTGNIELVSNQTFPYALAVRTNNNAIVISDFVEIDNIKNFKFTLDIKTTLADTGVHTAFSYYFGIYCYNANKEVIAVKRCTTNGFTDDSNPYFTSWGKNPQNTHDWKTYNAYLYGSSYNMTENNFDSTFKGNCNWAFVLPKEAKYIRVRFLHFRQSPTYGDDSTGTMFFANPTMMEIDDRFIATEKRLKVAEEKVEADAIVQTIKDSQTDGKSTFVLGSTFEQTVNAFNFNFTQTGVLNEVENSNFASVFRRWTFENPNNVRTFIEHSLNYGGGDIKGTFSVYCEECLGDNTVIYKQVITPKNPLMTTFTLSACYHYDGVQPSNGTSYPMAYVYLEFWNEDGTVEYYNQATLLDEGRTSVAWETIHNTWTREKKPIKEIAVAVYKRNTTGKMRITQIDLHEGSIHRNWIPNANEIVNNSTSIDNDGITVKMDEGEGKQGYSKINYEGISVHNANGEVKAWFGQNNTARIDDLEVRGRISNPYVLQKNTGRPFEFYVSPQQTGNGSGTDPSNRANSVNKVLEFVWNNYGCFSWRQDLTIHVAGGNYYEDIYIGGWLGSGIIKLIFDSNAVLYGTIVVEECTPFVELRGGRNGWDGNNGCIIYPTDTAITIRSSNCIVDGFRSRPSHYPNYGGTFVRATHGSRVLIASCDVVKYWHLAWADLLAFVHLADNRGDVQQLAGDAFNATYYLLGTNRPICNSGVTFINCWNTNIVEKNGAFTNSVWIPKDTTPPPPVESWQWFEQSFALTNLRSIPEGSGSGTSARYGEMGQGKWGSYKAHRGWADIPQALRDFCNGARNISIFLSLTRLNTNHGNAGASPVPKLIQTDGSVYSVGTGFARGDRHEVSIGGNLTNAFASGAKNSVEMFSTSSSDYSFYNNVVLRVRCEKRV